MTHIALLMEVEQLRATWLDKVGGIPKADNVWGKKEGLSGMGPYNLVRQYNLTMARGGKYPEYLLMSSDIMATVLIIAVKLMCTYFLSMTIMYEDPEPEMGAVQGSLLARRCSHTGGGLLRTLVQPAIHQSQRIHSTAANLVRG